MYSVSLSSTLVSSLDSFLWRMVLWSRAMINLGTATVGKFTGHDFGANGKLADRRWALAQAVVREHDCSAAEWLGNDANSNEQTPDGPGRRATACSSL